MRGRGAIGRTAVALATCALLVGAPYALRGPIRLRLLEPLPEGMSWIPTRAKAPEPAASVGEAEIGETKVDEAQSLPEEVALPAAKQLVAPPPPGEPRAPKPIEDPSGHALDGFFEALARVERKEPKAIARVTWYGDSIVATDFITGTIRRRLQRRFGDGGHGFVLAANGWPGYFHNDVDRWASSGWHVSRVVGPTAKDGLYGLGGVSFRSEGPGLLSRFATAKKGTFGRSVSRFSISYLAQPNGGRFGVKLDGVDQGEIDTSADRTQSARKVFEVPDGAHELELRVLSANVRMFGVSMEREGPGVVLDAIGILGARLRAVDLSDDAHWAEELRAHAPNLVAFHYGINEVEDGELYPLAEYEASTKAILAQVKRALPGASCLVVGALDRVDKRAGGYQARAFVPKLIASARRAAHESGCAFWDTFSAMGGSGAMGAWVDRGLGGADLAHPSSAGAEVIGTWVDGALQDAFDAWKRRALAGTAPAPSAAASPR